MEIRMAKPEDLQTILDIYNDAVLHSTATFDVEPETLAERQHWFAEHAPSKFPVICLVEQQQVVGWGSLSPYRARPAYNYSVEFSVYIHKDHQGRGYGRMLLTELLTLAENIGYHLVIGCIESSNTASLQLCYRLGFTYAGELTEVGHKFDRWLNTTFVQKVLK